jgi:hypothetical protein
VVDNGGAHGVITVEGTVTLKKGYHKLVIQYFDYVGGVIMSCTWKPPNARAFEAVPMDVLWHKPTGKKLKKKAAKTLPIASGESHLPAGYYPQPLTDNEKARFALLTGVCVYVCVCVRVCVCDCGPVMHFGCVW